MSATNQDTAATTIAAADAAWSASQASRWDARLEWLSDRLNPILVKETRQALKSRQFVITFVLLLIGGWFWSFAGPAFIGPRIYYSPAGLDMFFGYYLILAFPLAVIVPYSAFRSLAAEREDNTYELLSISTLASHQIISGKLGSAAVQMLVYFSALAPCLAFTYLLRGVDIITIGMLLYYTFFGSLGLAMIGLLFAAALRSRFGQVVLSLILIVGLLFAFWAAAGIGYGLLSYGPTFGELQVRWFWLLNSGLLLAYITYFALAFLAATGLLTFESESRSTGLRVVMVLQNVCLAGWVGTVMCIEGWEKGGVFVFALVSGIHWFVMGAFLTSEASAVSERVRRRLPRSVLGRTVLTWFNPGPGTGYMFIVANVTTVVVLSLIGAWTADLLGNAGRWPQQGELLSFLLLGHSYIVFYLGIGLLLIRLMSRWGPPSFVVASGIQFLLVLIGTMVPIVIQFSFVHPSMQDYTPMQLTNPFWTLGEVADGGLTEATIPTLMIIPVAALGLLAFHLPMVLRETTLVRVDAPERVREDDQALAPPPPEPPPESPWD